MKTYVIEREIPDAGSMSSEELAAASRKSCDVLSELGADIGWKESYVVDNKIYCVYNAANEGLIREHAERSGFPANRISEVKAVISPDTAK